MSDSGLSIYETSDLPEADQHDYDLQSKNEYETESVAEISTRDNYEQLTAEINSLLAQLQQLNNKNNESQNMSHIYKEVEEFKREMEIIGRDLEMVEKIRLTDPQSINFKKMLADVDKFKFPDKQVDPNIEATADLIEGSPDLMLKPRPSVMKPENASKLAELEVRLLRLEEIVGYEKINEFSKITGFLNMSVVQTMSNLELLNIENVGDVESRCGGVLRRLDQLSSSLKLLDDKEEMDKISHLYNFMLKLRPLESSIPELVNRLQALKQLHQHALSFNTLLKQLESTQAKIIDNLKDNKLLVKKVRDQMNSNLEIIKKKKVPTATLR